MRRYLYASLIDDVGIAATAWASALLMANLFTDQHQRMRVMVPTLLCFLLGTIVSGPLADWAERLGAAALASWRFRLVIGARVVETIALSGLVGIVAMGPPTVARIAPYMMVTAFMKTALRPTRIAFEVDLLERTSPQLDAEGRAVLDEHGQRRLFRPHLLPYSALTGALRSAAAVVGVLVGGSLMTLAHQAYWPLFAFDVLTNVVFVAIVVRACRPVVDPLPATVRAVPTRTGVLSGFVRSLREGLRFLFAREQRPLLALMFGSLLVELVSEAYDGKMIVKQVLHGTDEDLRHAYLVWLLISMVPLLALPSLARAMGSLGRVFLALLVVDGVLIACAGRIACVPAVASIAPFALLLGVDHALTVSATSLVDVAANSASSAGLRGRIAATYAFFVLVGDIVVEMLASAWSDAIGIAPMLVRLGGAQIVIVAIVAALGGRRLWNYGLRTPADIPSSAKDPSGVEGVDASAPRLEVVATVTDATP